MNSIYLTCRMNLRQTPSLQGQVLTILEKNQILPVIETTEEIDGYVWFRTPEGYVANVDEVFYEPCHPYTWALLESMPSLATSNRLSAIPGTPPNMIYPPKGDAFAARNKYAMKIDFEQQPPFFKVSDTHYAATWLLHEDAPKIENPLKGRFNKDKKEEKADE